MQNSLQEILLLITQLSERQAAINNKGEYIATPHVVVYNSPNTTVKVGKFYARQHETTIIGIEIIKGKEGAPTILFPVDISQLPKGFTFKYVNKED